MKTEVKEVETKFKPFEVVLTFESRDDVLAYYKELRDMSLGLTDKLYHILEEKLDEV